MHAAESLLAESYVNTVVIVDNASTDGCTQALVATPRTTILGMASNIGFGRGNNEGISFALRAGADFVLLLNQDAVVPGRPGHSNSAALKGTHTSRRAARRKQGI